MGSCEEIVIRLRNIQDILSRLELSILKLLRIEEAETTITTYNEWTHTQTGKSHIYQKTITLAGATQTETLPFIGYGHQLNHIFMAFNSANARTFTIDSYGFGNPTLYVRLDNVIGHTTPSRIVQLGAEFKTRVIRLDFNFSAYTVGDVIGIEVQVNGE